MTVPLLVVGVVAMLLAGSLGIALYAAIPATAPLRPEDSAAAARRCAACGRIESRRELDASFEFTVRMADGSSRVFLEDTAVAWRLGERLIYIDGADRSP